MPAGTITNKDLSIMQTLGRLVATSLFDSDFESAAEILAVTLLEGDKAGYTRLWIWFEEGARNYVENQYQLTLLERRLSERAKEIYEENKVPHKHDLKPYFAGRYRCSGCGGNTFTKEDL